MAHAHHCPHCLSLIARDDKASFPAAPLPCPDCRLLIGTGRSRSPEAIVGQGRSAAAAAGFRAASARRADAPPAAPEVVMDDLETVADLLDQRIERLRMTDYDVAHAGGAVACDVAVVLSTFGSWKAARAAAVARGAGASPVLDAELDVADAV